MAEQMFKVKNRSASRVGYIIPEDNIRRMFAPGETKTLPGSELVKLSYQPGGKEMMVAFLQISNERMLNALNINPEQEYFMSEKDIVELLTKGSLDAFLDCLDFAPTGVQDLIKKYAVSLPLTDLNKRRALKEKTGFDVDKAIELDAADKAPEKPTETKATTSAAPGYRRTTANYKPVEKAPAAAPAVEKVIEKA